MFDVALNQNVFVAVTDADTSISAATPLVDDSTGVFTNAEVSGCAGIYLSAVAATVFWRADGVTPTASNGHPLAANESIWLPIQIARLVKVVSDTGAVVASAVKAGSA